ncbi:MAG: hypothetical protein R3281_04150 [Balneolaceae bacterium]|nr:hypothetical protein [Balneolaceae bacterium]
MSNGSGGRLSGQNPFDMMYLTDVLDEALGSRLEGWEVLGDLRFRYHHDLERTERVENQGSSLLTRNTSDIKEIEVFANGRWYKNLSLNHQTGISGRGQYGRPLVDSSNPVQRKWNIVLNTGVNWLWSVADRWLVKAELANTYTRRQTAYSPGAGTTDSRISWNNRMFLLGRISYFVLNTVSVNLNVNSQLSYVNSDTGNNIDQTSRDFQLNYIVGLRYYFDRNLY